VNITSYNQAIASIDPLHKYVLLGNGFSIALKPDIFTYGSLYENADFSDIPHIRKLFTALGTEDFEIVIRHLTDTARVVRVYRPGLTRLIAKLEADADVIKDVLVRAIASRHPNRPHEISRKQYVACRKFLSAFRHIFTLNYDVTLYWALMNSEVDDLPLELDDGFRHPDEPDQTYVSWLQANSPSVHYLHGALHLFDAGSEIIKYTWSKTDIPIVEQIRDALEKEKYPLFVAEGKSANKKKRILHNAYLHKALRSFEACCNQARGAIVIYGHSLAENDEHILKMIGKGKVGRLLISIYGDPQSKANKLIKNNAEKIVAARSRGRNRYPLEVTYFDAESAKIWG
jgi:hypothetical protein